MIQHHIAGDVETNRDQQVDRKRSDGRDSERVTRATTERGIRSATATKGAGQTTALWTLDEHDENERNGNDDEEKRENGEGDLHGNPIYRSCGHLR